MGVNSTLSYAFVRLFTLALPDKIVNQSVVFEYLARRKISVLRNCSNFKRLSSLDSVVLLGSSKSAITIHDVCKPKIRGKLMLDSTPRALVRRID